MRLRFLQLFAFLLDVTCTSAALRLVRGFAGPVIESTLGFPISFPIHLLVALAIAGLLRLAGISIGEMLLAYPLSEHEAGSPPRQWPNLLMGTGGILGSAMLLTSWLRPDDGMPFFLLVEPTQTKLMAKMLYGALGFIGALMLLAFWPRARIFNGILIGATLLAPVLNYFFAHDAIVTVLLTRAYETGAPMTVEMAERYGTYASAYGVVFPLILLAILYLCRERPLKA